MRRREPGAIAATPVTGLSLGAYLELIKPRITALVVLTTATGLWLAPERPSFRTALFTVLGTILVVAAANVLNMYLERRPPPGAARGPRARDLRPRHFLAIALFRRAEFARAGLLVQPNEPDGKRQTRRNVVQYTAALVAVSLMLVPLGVAGRMYFAVAACSGAVFLAHGLKGLRPASSERWTRAEFIGSLAYLVVLLSVLVLDHARYV
jgi:heme O synthase-like polyprenyltransferase